MELLIDNIFMMTIKTVNYHELTHLKFGDGGEAWERWERRESWEFWENVEFCGQQGVPYPRRSNDTNLNNSFIGPTWWQ